MIKSNDEPPSLYEFAKALCRNWLNAMSGALSVPLAIVGLWVQTQAARWGLLITAFVCAFTAVYRVWADERRRVVNLLPAPMRERISILDMAKLAETKYGWDFKNGWQVLDFLLAIKHAANDGHIQLEGKQVDGWNRPMDNWRRAQMLYREIPHEQWNAIRLAIYTPKSTSFEDTDNFDVVVTRFGDEGPKYYDPHFSDRAAAIRWLEMFGNPMRGFHERTHREEEAAKAVAP